MQVESSMLGTLALCSLLSQRAAALPGVGPGSSGFPKRQVTGFKDFNCCVTYVNRHPKPTPWGVTIRSIMLFKPALIVVDVQEDFCPPVGALQFLRTLHH